LHTSIKGFPFVTSEFLFSFSILGVILFITLQKMDCIHLMDKDVHSPYAIEMELMTISPLCGNNFFYQWLLYFN
jgi:hypothetical protein